MLLNLDIPSVATSSPAVTADFPKNIPSDDTALCDRFVAIMKNNCGAANFT
jgi:hypothetical protein